MNLLLIDAKGLLYRAVFSKNTVGGFIGGVIDFVCEAKQAAHPADVVFVFDTDGIPGRHEPLPVWRRAVYSDYKGKRTTDPKLVEMRQQVTAAMPGLVALCEASGYTMIATPGVEADDLIHIAARRHVRLQLWDRLLILSNDRDYYSALHPRVAIIKPIPGAPQYTVYDFQTEYGITPDLWPEVKALEGDTSDNVPGLPNVGRVKALRAVKEGVRASVPLPPEGYPTWAQHWDKATLSYSLVNPPITAAYLPTPYQAPANQALSVLPNERKRRAMTDEEQRERLRAYSRVIADYRLSALMHQRGRAFVNRMY